MLLDQLREPQPAIAIAALAADLKAVELADEVVLASGAQSVSRKPA
jgi:hypothetical protein